MFETAPRLLRATLMASALISSAMLVGSSVARAQGSATAPSPTYSRIATVAIPGAPLAVFDISFVDRQLPLYYLADRSNAGLDIVETITNRFLARVGGFVGVRETNGAADTSISGPDGVQAVGLGEVWVGDGDSSVKVVSLITRSVVDIISTVRTDEPGHTADTDKRADEMSYDPKDQLLAVANNAATPPFISLISTRAGDRRVVGRVVYSDAAGIEQSVYNPSTGLFYVNLTQVGSDPNVGALSVIDPLKGAEVNRFPVTGCNGAGLALGPNQNLLIGCSLTNNSQVISALDGSLVAAFPEVSGSDEVWYNPGDGNYYLGARNNPAAAGGPVLGIIDAQNNEFVANVPTTAASHSVAADPRNNHIFVPLGPSPADAACVNGCIGVYAAKGKASLAQELVDSLSSNQPILSAIDQLSR